MIYPLGGLILGGVIGAVRARRRGGTVADMLQWGAAFGLICGLIGLFILIFVQRSMV